MAIYTRTGDRGQTRRIDGQPVSKDTPRIEAVGALDELNSHLGLCLLHAGRADLRDVLDALQPLQGELFALGATAAGMGTDVPIPLRVDPAAVDRMESQIDAAFKAVGGLEAFVLPGGCETACHLHLARTACRRAERALVAFARSEPQMPPLALQLLNRLSDLLFALALLANLRSGAEEATWSGEASGTA